MIGFKIFRNWRINQKIKQKERLLADLEIFLADNTQAWNLRGDGSYERVQRENAAAVSAQQSFLGQLST